MILEDIDVSLSFLWTRLSPMRLAGPDISAVFSLAFFSLAFTYETRYTGGHKGY